MIELRLECREPPSSKFWMISDPVRVESTRAGGFPSHVVWVRWGKIGADGQAKPQTFGMRALAVAFVERKVAEKLRGGYRVDRLVGWDGDFMPHDLPSFEAAARAIAARRPRRALIRCRFNHEHTTDRGARMCRGQDPGWRSAGPATTHEPTPAAEWTPTQCSLGHTHSTRSAFESCARISDRARRRASAPPPVAEPVDAPGVVGRAYRCAQGHTHTSHGSAIGCLPDDPAPTSPSPRPPMLAGGRRRFRI